MANEVGRDVFHLVVVKMHKKGVGKLANTENKTKNVYKMAFLVLPFQYSKTIK